MNSSSNRGVCALTSSLLSTLTDELSMLSKANTESCCHGNKEGVKKGRQDYQCSPYLAIVDYLRVAPEQSWQQSPGRNMVGDVLPRPQ